MSYSFAKKVAMSYEDALVKVTEELQKKRVLVCSPKLMLRLR